ncbi:hypothetical protein AAC387_Pa09g1056 [Persea americana]
MGGKSSKSQCHYPHSCNRGPPSWGTSPRPSFSGNHFESDMMDRRPRRFARIDDNYHSLDQVTEALAKAGLESSNLIVGIDFTKSNEWTGSRSFHHRSLHHISDFPNPYEQAISIIGRTLSAFDEDSLIPCFGFGDATTHDQEVFSFYPEEKPCNGFEEVLQRYRELVPHLKLAGPTSFAPIIEKAIGTVDRSHGQYHVLLIIADGQVTRSVDTDLGHLSPQEQNTIEAIVKASEYPLSIVLVGVGDGPWDMMHQFDDNIPSRAFDNFQFVNFTEIMARHISTSKKETEFALAALMEIPSQYKATLELQLLGRQIGTQGRISLPPPTRTSGPTNFTPNYSRTNHFEHIAGGYNGASAHTSENSPQNIQACPVCFWSVKDLAFGCGHRTCYDCGKDMTLCPICRSYITTRIRLY